VRFLLDENVPHELARALAARGHEALLLPPHLRAADDADILEEAVRDGRVLVTLDTDFGTLVFAHARTPPSAVVLIRLRVAELVVRIDVVVAAIEQAASSGMFVVIDGQGVRTRPLPWPRS
jgi:predicted nuclease of predicted toxin-antitoxin system